MSVRPILAVHNFYQQSGGEDRVFAMESALLEQRGHRVIRYQDHNDRIRSGIAAGVSAIWNQRSYTKLKSLARAEQPHVAHFHNTFPLISPAGYYAVASLGIPVVQTLSNFRLLCPGGLLLRNGRPCEDCVGHRSFLPAIRHRCYRDSGPATASVASMLLAHRAIGTWTARIDAYVALSEFARRTFVSGGIPADRILVKPNFVHPDPGPGEGSSGYALFAGRLSIEKGLDVLAQAFRMLPEIPLRIAGDGPLSRIDWPPNVTFLGNLSHERLMQQMKDAAVLVFPSICYENAPVTILEALACGLPIMASDIGSIPEMVAGDTGLMFRAGDSGDLVRKIRLLFAHPQRLREMRTAARRRFEQNYTAERNYRNILETYEFAAENARRRSSMHRSQASIAEGSRP